MTELKATPGPWDAEKASDGNWWVYAAEGEVAQVMPWSRAVDRADAHLIAAAPDMYEALQSAEESIATFIGIHNYPSDSGAQDVFNEIRAALAKARGE